MSHKPNYGFDAPNVIRWLLIFAIVSFGVAIFAYSLVHADQPLMALLISGYFCLTAFAFLIPALWMLYGTQIGKQKIIAETLDRLSLQGNETILDAGCGRGLFLIEAAKRLPNGKACGIDLWHTKDQSGNGPESARSNAALEGVQDRIEIQTADICSIPYPDGSFDFVLSSLAIHNIEEESERGQALKELYRVLKPGGQIILIDFKYAPHYAAILRSFGAADLSLSNSIYRYFPPLRIVKGRKPR